MATGPTVAKIGFYRDDAPAIDIEQSSGSEALDQLLLRCLANVPPNIQIHPPFKMQFKVTFSWKPNAAAAASQAQSEAASPSPVKQ